MGERIDIRRDVVVAMSVETEEIEMSVPSNRNEDARMHPGELALMGAYIKLKRDQDFVQSCIDTYYESLDKLESA